MPEINYSGPSDEYIPMEGEGIYSQQITASLTNPIATYANISYLNQALAALVAQCTNLIQDMQTELQSLALVVTTDPTDTNLNNANEVLWPSSLGTPPSYITYLYYTSLANVNSSAAAFIRNAYETAARGVTGNNAIDLLPLTQTTLDEANFIQDFSDTYAGDLSDSSQRRTVELLQDWVESAQQQITNIQNQFTNGSTSQLDASDISSLSNADASNSQAILQVNLNQLNSELVQSLGVLQTYFTTYQSTFYNNVLGPAMGLRNNVITQTYPILPGTIGNVINTSTDILNTNLQAVLADQLRRNTVYTTQVSNILTTVQSRDSYRNYIVQLAATGQSIPSGSSGTMVTATDTPEQASYFQSATAPDATPSNPYMAPHSQLSGLTDALAHPQYLLKDGDTMLGNLLLATPNGTFLTEVLVDGMRPGTHAHTGADGTVQIHGSNILSGSVGTSAVNTTEQPIVPTDLILVSQNADTTNGSGTVDINLSWTGDDDFTYEIQIAKASS